MMNYNIDNTQNDAIKVSINGNILTNKDTEILKQAVLEKLELYLRSNGKAKVIFELKDLHMISSLGIGFFLKTLKVCEKNGGNLELQNLNEKLKKILRITKLNEIFNVS